MSTDAQHENPDSAGDFDAEKVAREIRGVPLPDDNDAQRIAAKIREMGC